MKKILLVEDDNLFRSTIKSILGKHFQILEATNGKRAYEIISAEPPDLVITDIQMPQFNGVELLKWIKKNKPLPVILMTGFSQILETQQARELGADEFLTKPFREEELFEKLKKFLKEESGVEKIVQDLDPEFCKIPVEDFICERESEYGIYIRMSATKYIKIAHKGGKLSADKIAAFREKGLTHLYIRQEDFAKLVGFTILASKAVSLSNQVEKAKKVRFMQYTGELVMQKAFVQGTDEILFRSAKDFLSTSMNILTEDQETFGLLDQLSTHTDHLYAHSLGVSVFSVMIAKQMGWQSPQVLLNLINNAHDALENADEKWIEVKLEETENEIRLSVSDSGPGIPHDLKEKIFNPFFTTKPVGKGTGMGLSISHGIVRSHHGSLEINDKEKRTSFVISLPKEFKTSAA